MSEDGTKMVRRHASWVSKCGGLKIRIIYAHLFKQFLNGFYRVGCFKDNRLTRSCDLVPGLITVVLKLF